jgi:hypothetical protein
MIDGGCLDIHLIGFQSLEIPQNSLTRWVHFSQANGYPVQVC